MIHRHGIKIATGCLMLLWTAATAQQQTTIPPITAQTQTTVPPIAAQPAPVKPSTIQPGLPQLAPGQPGVVPTGVIPPDTGPQPVTVPLLVPPATVITTTSPALAPIVKPIAPPPPPLGSELRGKLKEDERHFGEKSAAAKREFDLRQAEEKKAYEMTLVDMGFWERHRLTRIFRAEQAKRYREFNDEQEAKRRTYEWRYP